MSFDKDWYRRWRSTVPWDDETIALALESLAIEVEAENDFIAKRYRYFASRVRCGFLSKVSLAVALCVLVKTCAICGKKALYRQGNSGRCREHKYIQDQFALIKRKRLEDKGRDIGDEKKIEDRFLLSRGQPRSHKRKTVS